MKLINIFKRGDKTKTTGAFSDFLLHASKNKKQEVFIETARQANEDQKKIFEEARLKTKAG
jgi:hypothetical protein